MVIKVAGASDAIAQINVYINNTKHYTIVRW